MQPPEEVLFLPKSVINKWKMTNHIINTSNRKLPALLRLLPLSLMNCYLTYLNQKLSGPADVTSAPLQSSCSYPTPVQKYGKHGTGAKLYFVQVSSRKDEITFEMTWKWLVRQFCPSDQYLGVIGLCGFLKACWWYTGWLHWRW